MSKRKQTEKDVAVEPMPLRGSVSFRDPFEHFNQLFTGWPEFFGNRWPERTMGLEGMKVEEYVEEDCLVVRGEIPGIDPDKDLEISVDHGRLSIKAERRQQTEDTENGYRSEFRYGSYARVIALPEGASVDNISANYEDGILEVKIPIDSEATSARKIPVGRN